MEKKKVKKAIILVLALTLLFLGFRHLYYEANKFRFVRTFSPIRLFFERYYSPPDISPTALKDMQNNVDKLYSQTLSIRGKTDNYSKVLHVNAQSGSDSNNGTKDAPLKTIQKAVNNSSSGTLILVASGNYRNEGEITIKNKKFKDGLVIIGSSSPVFGSPSDLLADSVVYKMTIQNSKNVQISNFTFVGDYLDSSQVWVDMPEVIVDDPSVEILVDKNIPWEQREERIKQKFGTVYELHKSWLDNYTLASVNSTRITITNNEFTNSKHGVVLNSGTKHAHIKDNYIHRNNNGIAGYFDLLDKYGYVSFEESIIENNLIEQHLITGITVRSGARNNLIKGNTVRYSGQTHINTWRARGGNIFIENDVRFGGYYSEIMKSPGSSAMSIHSGGRGNVVMNNIMANHIDYTGNDGNGIIFDFTPEGGIIANNIIYNNMGSGISLTKSGNITIVHNTVVNNGLDAQNKQNGYGFRTSQGNNGDNVVANNIFYNNGTGEFRIDEISSKNQKFFDYNLVYNDSDNYLGSSLESKKFVKLPLDTLHQFGIGKNDTISDPMLVTNEINFFSVPLDSPAYGAGTLEYTLPFDHNQNDRSEKTVTVGALNPGVIVQDIVELTAPN